MNKIEELKIKLEAIKIKKEFLELQNLEKNTIQKNVVQSAIEQLSAHLYTHFNNDKKVFDIIDRYFANIL